MAPTTSAAGDDKQEVRDAVWRVLDAMSSGDASAEEIVLKMGKRDGEVLDAMWESMRAAERLRISAATATNSRAQSDAEVRKFAADVRRSVANATVTIEGDVGTLVFDERLEEGEGPREVKMHAQRIGGQWKVDALRFTKARNGADAQETIDYMLLHAKAQDAVAAQFDDGKLKNAAALDYLVRMQMMRIAAEATTRRTTTRTTTTQEVDSSQPAQREPKASASDPPARGEVRRIMTDGRVAAVAFSLDGNLLVSGARLAERSLRLWNAATGELVRDFHTPAELDLHVLDVGWLAGGKQIVTCGQTFDRAAVRELLANGRGSRVVQELDPVDFALRVWDVETGRPLREMTGHTGAVFRIALSPDGSTVASASADGTVRLWDPASGREKLKIDAVPNHDFAHAIEFFPNGKQLASFGSDNTIRVFDATNGEEVHRWTIERGTFELAISPDGDRVACGRLTLQRYSRFGE